METQKRTTLRNT